MGYKYEKDGNTYYEFHVDNHPTFKMACNNLLFCRNLSVQRREDAKPLMMLGQDEAIIKKLFTLFALILPDGSKPLIPKDKVQLFKTSKYGHLKQ